MTGAYGKYGFYDELKSRGGRIVGLAAVTNTVHPDKVGYAFDTYAGVLITWSNDVSFRKYF